MTDVMETGGNAVGSSGYFSVIDQNNNCSTFQT